MTKIKNFLLKRKNAIVAVAFALTLMTSALGLCLTVGVNETHAFYSTSTLITDGQAIVSEGRGFFTDVIIPYVLPLVFAVGVLMLVWRYIRRVFGSGGK